MFSKLITYDFNYATNASTNGHCSKSLLHNLLLFTCALLFFLSSQEEIAIPGQDGEGTQDESSASSQDTNLSSGYCQYNVGHFMEQVRKEHISRQVNNEVLMKKNLRITHLKCLGNKQLYL